jgi:F0F1-type ATP synthase assembly protein I
MTSPPSNKRDTADEVMVGNGFEAGFVVIIFAGVGYFLDRWLGTTPWFVIGLFVLGAIGLFYKLKASYGAKMDSYEVERLSARSAGGRSSDVTP